MERYYNENPQVKHWMEKCEMLQQELDIAIEFSEETDKRVRLSIKCWRDSLEGICNKKDKLIGEMKHFNALPWYKKMFYKFKI